MRKVIRIGSRKSRLALVQAEMVKERLLKACPELTVEIVGMSTKGDEQQERSLQSFGGRGVFTRELEEALLGGEIDLAVHSAKDMPMDFPEGLHIGAALPRGPVGDVLVTRDGTKLFDLKPGSVVGTGSLRRELQLKARNPLIRVRPVRGNVQTRLRKLSDGEYDALVLAAAGLSRLGLVEEDGLFFEYLGTDVCLPAAGQAILAVESRTGDLEAELMAINDPAAAAALCAERAFLQSVGGSCNAPAAAYARFEGGALVMDALYAPDGRHIRRASGQRCPGTDQAEAGALGRELAAKLLQGKVWLAGAGPGDPGLVTRRCLAAIRQADAVVYDSLATDALLNEARPDAELIYAGKRASHHHLRQEETNALLIRLAREGKSVVRLKGGDPFIFGRGGEEAQELRRAGVDFEIISGVSSCYGAPAYAGIPVTHREYASSFHVVTGHAKSGREDGAIDYAELAREEGTLVFLMGLGNLPDIASQLIANGKDPQTPAAVIQEGTTARQRVVTASLAHIAEEAARARIAAPAVTVIGNVVSLREETGWFGRGALFGKRVLLTATGRLTEKLLRVLEAEGAQCVPFSLIRTEPLCGKDVTDAIEALDQYTWLVFTSANGVEYFFDALIRAGRDIRTLSGLRFAVIGDGTKAALAERGILADFVPSRYSSRDLASEWIPTLQASDRVLLLRAREASEELPGALQAAGIPFTAAALYHTAADRRKEEELVRLLPQVDYVTLASASAARTFASMLGGQPCAARIVCIGPVTARAAEAAGLSVYRSAVEYTAEGIRDVLLYDALREP